MAYIHSLVLNIITCKILSKAYGAVHAKGDIFVKNEYSLQDGT